MPKCRHVSDALPQSSQCLMIFNRQCMRRVCSDLVTGLSSSAGWVDQRSCGVNHLLNIHTRCELELCLSPLSTRGA